MDDVSHLVKSAGELANRAIFNDYHEGKLVVATYFYFEAINLLERAIYCLHGIIRSAQFGGGNHDLEQLGKQVQALQSKIDEYRNRVDALQEAIKIKEKTDAMASPPRKSSLEVQKERAYFLVNQALEKDEAGASQEAIDLYTEAVALCLEVKNGGKLDEKTAAQIFDIAKKALGRAEELKGIRFTKPKVPDELSQSQGPSFAADRHSPLPPLSAINRNLRSSSPVPMGGPLPSGNGGGKGGYTEEEKKVLLATSIINGREYVPFMSVDLGEKFAYPLPFTDPKGRLQLAPKQLNDFKEWKRPDDLWPEPKMIELVSCYSIKQTVISDCSFVASLAVSALYERKFNKKLITSIIYPQNKAGEPVYNPCGKYMIKLHLNGVKRKVIIDDMLPVGNRGQLLCSYSNTRGELWVSLLEKAYMKVMGGYDFPGSNSNIDLHALTGWIPERIAIHPQDSSMTFEKDKVFRMLQEHMQKGNVLVTVATGDMDEKEAERAGLVTCHAYAVLEAVTVNNVRLLKLKNPWSHLRWKGNYSELDVTHWTEELKDLLKYDPKSASMFDNGVFWIDYDSICKFFDVFYLNWNPKLFANTAVIHKTWHAGVGPVKDAYTIGCNPQYALEVNSTGDSSVVWVLLTRHITDIQDFKNNREYITVLVYDADGKKVFYPYDPPPIIDGVRINSPHYLCKIQVKGSGRKRYTLVVSQYAKMNSIHYTLRAYSSSSIKLREIVHEYKAKEKITGEWKGNTAGGCPNHPHTFGNNPNYQLHLKGSSPARILVELKARKDFQVGFAILTQGETFPSRNSISSGAYRSGYCVLETETLQPGVYKIIPSTFSPNCEGPFFLEIQATCDFSVQLIS